MSQRVHIHLRTKGSKRLPLGRLMIRCVFSERSLVMESREPMEERSEVRVSGGVTTILKWTREQAWRMEGCGRT